MNKVKSFKYMKANGSISNRKVYIIHEGATSYIGFDLLKLTQEESDLVEKVFEKKPITPPPAPGSTRLDYMKLGINKAIFQKAYRTFLKSRIVN